MFKFFKELIAKVASKNIKNFTGIYSRTPKQRNIFKIFGKLFGKKPKKKVGERLFDEALTELKKKKNKSSKNDGVLRLPKSVRDKNIARLVAKSTMIEKMITDEADMLRGKILHTPKVDEYVKDINKNIEILETKTNMELKDYEEMLDKNLKDLNIDPTEFDKLGERAIYNRVKLNSYNTFMDSWRAKFIDSDIKTDGHEMSIEEKISIWEDIHRDRDYHWYTTKKLSKNDL